MTVLKKNKPITAISQRIPLWLLPVFAIISGWAIWYQATFIPENNRKYFGLWGNKLDLHVYMAGAERFLSGKPIYEGPIYEGMEYTYTPFSTMVFSAMEWMSKTTTERFWTSFNLVLLVVVVLLSFRSLGYRVDWRVWFSSVTLGSLFLLLEPVRDTFWFGQINLVLLILVIADLLRPATSKLRGIGVGIAAGIKLTPAFFILYAISVKQWKTAIVASVTFIATIVLGFILCFDDANEFWFRAVRDSRRVGDTNSAGNQSLTGALSQMNDHAEKSNGVLYFSLAIGLTILGLWAASLAYRAHQPLLALIIAGMTSTTVSPFSWGHHWVWSVPLLVFLLHLIIQAVSKKKLAALVVAVLGFSAIFAIYFVWIEHQIIWVTKDSLSWWQDRYDPGLFLIYKLDEWRWFTGQPFIWSFFFVVTATVIWFFRFYREPLVLESVDEEKT